MTWSLGATPVKSYALDGAGEVALTASDTVAKAEINFYWLRGGDPKGDRVLVNAPLLRNDGAESASASAGAQYKAIEPVVSTFGFQQKSPIADFDYEAGAPQIVGGYFAATQTIGNQNPYPARKKGLRRHELYDRTRRLTDLREREARDGGIARHLESDRLARAAAQQCSVERYGIASPRLLRFALHVEARYAYRYGNAPCAKLDLGHARQNSWQWAASAKRQNATSPWTGPDATSDGSGPYLYSAPTPETTQPPQWSMVDASGKFAACAALPR